MRREKVWKREIKWGWRDGEWKERNERIKRDREFIKGEGIRREIVKSR